MKINKIKFQNFRIYKGENEILFAPNASKNISIVAGKNGFGKTTFLTSLIWVFYGKMMSEVEDKYKKDIKNAGGYDKFIKTLLNREIKTDYENNGKINPIFSIEIELKEGLFDVADKEFKIELEKKLDNLNTKLKDGFTKIFQGTTDSHVAQKRRNS